MKDKFNLSEKIEQIDFTDNVDTFIRVEDIKEFIKRLKEEIPKIMNWEDDDGTFGGSINIHKIIDKFAGDKLI